MPEVVVFLLRAVVLVLLWGFVAAAVVAVRHDVFGTKPATAKAARSVPVSAPGPASPRRPAAPAARRLVVVEGAQAGATVALGQQPVSIGRAADSALVLTDDFASNHHARLVPTGSGWRLEDTGSTNGTFVNGSRVSGTVDVAPQTQIRIGRTVLELRP